MKSFQCVASFSLINERRRLRGPKEFGRTLSFLKKSVFFTLAAKVSAMLIKHGAQGASVDEDLHNQVHFKSQVQHFLQKHRKVCFLVITQNNRSHFFC